MSNKLKSEPFFTATMFYYRKGILWMLLILFKIVFVCCDEQCDCRTVLFIKELVQEEITEMKLENMRLQSELDDLRERIEQTKPALAGITVKTESEIEGRFEALEQRFAEFERRSEPNNRGDIVETEGQMTEPSTEFQPFFKQTMIKALQKEKIARVKFFSEVMSLMQNFSYEISDLKAYSEALVNDQLKTQIEDSREWEKNMSQLFENLKDDFSLKEHVTQTNQNVNKCFGDIAALKVNVGDVAADLQNKFDRRLAEVDRKLSTLAVKLLLCPDGWEGLSDKCYFFSRDKKIWTDASSYCKGRGGHLVEIRTADENAYIASEIKKRNQKDNFWIGLNDRYTDGMWHWESSADLNVTYTNWGDGEPNNYKSDEDCVEMYNLPTNGVWNDRNCKEARHYVCESDPQF